jgi:hypothetical protein
MPFVCHSLRLIRARPFDSAKNRAFHAAVMARNAREETKQHRPQPPAAGQAVNDAAIEPATRDLHGRTRNPYTQRAIERAIRAALAAGLKVVAVRPDGTVLTEHCSAPSIAPALTDTPKPRDARDKLGVF